MIIGCDFHPGFGERRLSHREEAARFYRSLAGKAVRVGVEATGNDR